MTQEHPVTPPPDLMEHWLGDFWPQDALIAAAQWGADKELEACLNWLTDRERFPVGHEAIEELRAARRSKPPSLKEQALAELAEWENVMDIAPDSPIRRALDQLSD